MKAIVARLLAACSGAGRAARDRLTPASAPAAGRADAPRTPASLARAAPRARAAAPSRCPTSVAATEMADALAAAVERLRARAERARPPPGRPPARRRPAAKPPPHKHSMSLIKRWRIRRTRRGARLRRSDA